MSLPRRRLARSAGFYSTATVLAVLFLFPLVWTLYSSVHGREASGGGNGWGIEDYKRLFHYGSGLPTYLSNTAIVAPAELMGSSE